jgi:hypothetical protein
VLTNSLLAAAVASADVLADYSAVSNCVVTHWPVSITYTSSATAIATVDTNGQVHAVSPGTVTITATMGGFSSSVVVTITSAPVNLIHRYSFSETSGTDASDSIGGPAYDGTLNPGASFVGGQVVLDGVSGYVQLPPGILTNMSAVTIETWASFGATIPNWGVLFTFGDTDSGTGNGMNYISCQPHTGFGTTQIGISDADPGFNHELDAVFNGVLDGQTNVHIVAVYYPAASYTALYTNGTLVALNSSITISLAAAFATGDPLNYIGHSLYSADPYFSASVDEFRIYNGPLQAPAIKADAALGPNQLIGTATNISLTAAMSGGNVVLSWPTTSALVNVQTSSALGNGAVWTTANGTLTVSGGNYYMTIPAGTGAQFFRLQN